jgi:hypothetical protein
MVRKWIMAVLLGSAMASGQTTVIRVSSTQLENEPKVSVIPKAQVVQRYDKLRQGHDELVAVFADTRPLCYKCRISRELDRSLHENEVQLEPLEGFTFRYAQGQFDKPVTLESRVWKTTTITKAGWVNLIRIKASRDVPPGDYTIRGRLVVATIEDNVYNRRQVDVVIPITVVGKNAKVHKTSWGYDPRVDHHIKSTLAWIAIAPAIPFILIFLEIACRGDNCS